MIFLNDTTVIESPARNKDGQISRVMRIGIAQITTKKNRGLIEQRTTRLFLRFHLIQKRTKLLHNFPLNHLQLRNLGGISAMMGKVVMFRGHTGNLRN